MSLPTPLDQHRVIGRVALLWILALVLPSVVGATSIHPALSALMEEGPDGRTVPVWVFFTDHGFRLESERQAALSFAQQRITDAALARRARTGRTLADRFDLDPSSEYVASVARFGRIRHRSCWLNGVSADVRLGDIRRIASLPFVSEIRPVAKGRRSTVGPRSGPDGRLLEQPLPGSRYAAIPREKRDDLYGPSFDQLDEIGIIEAHDAGYLGARVRLMMLDTGFRKDHDAFRETDLLAEHDYVFGDGNTQDETEDDPGAHWHGTATWGTCGGYAPGALIGPAYRATFILAKSEDVRSELPIEEDNYVAALEWGDSLGVMVTSASLTYMLFEDGSGWTYEELDGDTAPITRAIDRAAERGILCVNAMGNRGPEPGTLQEPADADTMLACGAVNADGEIAGFSSRGPRVDGMIKPEVVARGVDTRCADANDPHGYASTNGTSLSTPLVSGGAAVVMEAHPEWSIWEVREALLTTAQRWSDPNNDYGYGRIDVWAAIQYGPIIVPVPFDLVSPSSDGPVSEPSPTFVWNRSSDPQGGEIRYELWIDEEEMFDSPIIYADLIDTSLTISHSLEPDTTYYWRVLAEEPDGYHRLCRADYSFDTLVPTGPEDLPLARDGWRLEVAPNPWQPSSVMRFYAPPGSEKQEVHLTILDPSGRRISRRSIEVNSVGWNEWSWVPLGREGRRLPAGVYLALLETPGQAARTKIVLTH